MRFKGLDLNLLVALDVLFQEMNVTRAASRLNMTQSTMSGVLLRLRTHFKDELLVPYGRSLHQTPLAEQLQGPLREAIVKIDAIVTADGTFDPAISVRHFKVEFPDHLIPVLLPAISQRLLQFAPNVTVEFALPHGDPAPLLHRGELDLVITPSPYRVDEYPMLTLIDDEVVIVGWEGNPALDRPLDKGDLETMPLVKFRFDSRRMSGLLSDDELKIVEGRGNVFLIAPTFSSIPALLVGTPAIAFIHRNLAEAAARQLPLRIRSLPFPSPMARDVIMYHPTRAEDDGLSWLIDQFLLAARALERLPVVPL
jgi:LysR family transcriptional regulator, nod-box dependent transcriptional activator